MTMAEMFSFAVTLKVRYDIRDNLQDTWNTLKEFWACHFMVTPQNATHLCITLLTPLTSARNITWLIYDTMEGEHTIWIFWHSAWCLLNFTVPVTIWQGQSYCNFLTLYMLQHKYFGITFLWALPRCFTSDIRVLPWWRFALVKMQNATEEIKETHATMRQTVEGVECMFLTISITAAALLDDPVTIKINWFQTL